MTIWCSTGRVRVTGGQRTTGCKVLVSRSNHTKCTHRDQIDPRGRRATILYKRSIQACAAAITCKARRRLDCPIPQVITRPTTSHSPPSLPGQYVSLTHISYNRSVPLQCQTHLYSRASANICLFHKMQTFSVLGKRCKCFPYQPLTYTSLFICLAAVKLDLKKKT